MIGYQDPIDYWKAHPSYVICELDFIIGAAIMIVHGLWQQKHCLFHRLLVIYSHQNNCKNSLNYIRERATNKTPFILIILWAKFCVLPVCMRGICLSSLRSLITMLTNESRLRVVYLLVGLCGKRYQQSYWLSRKRQNIFLFQFDFSI